MRLMKSNTLLDRCRVNTNIESDTFVGVTKKEGYYEVSFPLGYHLSSDEKGLRKDVLLLMNILSKYSEKKESELYKGMHDDQGIPIQSYLYLIKDFYEHGYYKERERLYVDAKKGKINWGRTIKQHKPVISGNDAYYLDFIVNKNTINENELITLVHKFCVHESFERFGWLFTSFVPPRPKFGLNRKMMISVVRDKMQNTFKDQNKQLFKNMLIVLNCLNDDSEIDFRYGTNRFEYVWEKMIDRVFGIDEKADYFPKTTWKLRNNRKYDNAVLEPDSIMIYNNKVFVLDAKYYKYGWSGIPSHLPESTSINKQITYGEYIAESGRFLLNGEPPIVYNAFLMPFDSKGKVFKTNSPIHYIGTATSDWKDGSKEYENVVGVLLDVKHLMGLENRQDYKEITRLAEVIETYCFELE